MTSPIFAALEKSKPEISDFIGGLPLPSAKILAKSCFGFYWAFIDIRNLPIRLIYSLMYAQLHPFIDAFLTYLETKGYPLYKNPHDFKTLEKIIAVSLHFFTAAILLNTLLQSKHSLAIFSEQQTKLWRVLVLDMVIEGGAYSIKKIYNFWHRLWHPQKTPD